MTGAANDTTKQVLPPNGLSSYLNVEEDARVLISLSHLCVSMHYFPASAGNQSLCRRWCLPSLASAPAAKLNPTHQWQAVHRHT